MQISGRRGACVLRAGSASNTLLNRAGFRWEQTFNSMVAIVCRNPFRFFASVTCEYRNSLAQIAGFDSHPVMIAFAGSVRTSRNQSPFI